MTETAVWIMIFFTGRAMEGKVAGFGEEGRCSAGETLNCMVLSLAGRFIQNRVGSLLFEGCPLPLGGVGVELCQTVSGMSDWADRERTLTLPES